MDNEDKIQQILTELQESVASIERVLREHGHEGVEADGTARLRREIDLLASQTLGAGGVMAMTGLSDVAADRTLLVAGTGRDSTAADGLINSTLYLEHQYATEATTKQTFYYGLRGPQYSATEGGNIVSGEAVLSQNVYKWPVDQLVNAYVVVNNSAGSTFDGFQILSNTEGTLTINGTWNFTAKNVGFTIFMPIYLGSASYPWRRIYTGDLTGGGIRFGYGATAGGQNGLLYTDASGNLYYRDYAGASVQLNSGSSGSFLVAGDGSVVTISGGSITPTTGFHEVDTEGGAATDDLDTIVSTGISDGSFLVLRATSSSRTVVIKDGTGNLRTAGDFTMDHNRDTITFIKAGVWLEVSRSDNDT